MCFSVWAVLTLKSEVAQFLPYSPVGEPPDQRGDLKCARGARSAGRSQGRSKGLDALTVVNMLALKGPWVSRLFFGYLT